MSIPNLISLGRLLLVPVAVWLILERELAWAFWVFLVAGASDGLDGFLARLLDQRTRLGAFLDPIADKAMVVSCYITLGWADYLPNWLVILVVSRDLLIVGAALLLMVLGQTATIKPLFVSKANTAMQLVLAIAVLAVHGGVVPDPGLLPWLIWATGATTVLSGAAYVVQGVRRVSGIEDLR
ncbi:MAG TPA: CDP-alcohol phosphatidyltransferase family protein [Alphaproteobacteria bacterium]|nr:CDP-alcohol phosphatidyltransferase family protein [Alphaproteobacteria bacterium]